MYFKFKNPAWHWIGFKIDKIDKDRKFLLADNPV